jgi:hypothetical protein
MKYLHELAFLAGWLTADEVKELERLVPEARGQNGFRYRVEVDNLCGDEFVERAISFLRNHSIPRYSVVNSTHYGYTVTRVYDQAEYEAAEYLFITGCPKTLDRDKEWKMDLAPIRDEQGRLLILARDATPKLRIGSAHWPDNLIVVSDEVRGLMESGDLLGLRFGEVALKGKSTNTSLQPFWELQSAISLPQIANTDKLIYRGGPDPGPFRGDYSRRLALDDSPFRGGELHYRRTDLAKVGVFDIATPFEMYLFSRPLVISQRFYQHCLEHKIPLEVEPVRIDPD